MGLDVYKYKLIKDNPFNHVIDSTELYNACENENMTAVIFMDHQYYSHTENARLLDLFNKFDKYTGTTLITNLIDYSYYNSLYGKEIDSLDEIYGHDILDIKDLYIHDETFSKVLVKYEEDCKRNIDNEFNLLCFILKSGDEILGIHEDLLTYSRESKYLLFSSVGYARSGEFATLYDNFYGDCWYKKENTGLDMRSARHFVYPEELDELKKCFNEYSNIHEWTLNDDEIIYLNP